MAEYYLTKFKDNVGEEFADPLTLEDMSGVTAEILLDDIQGICEENGIPVNLKKVSVEVSEGVFKKSTYSAVEITHPCPPQKFAGQLYLISQTGIRFFIVGKSKAMADKRNYEAAKNGTGGSLMARLDVWAGVKQDDSMYEAEMDWHNSVYGAFMSLID